VNGEFTAAKVQYQNQSSASREEKLKDLAAAYDSYVELKGNLEEGTKVVTICEKTYVLLRSLF